MSNPQRYHPRRKILNAMEQKEHGEWIHHSDYAKLKAELEQAKDLLREADPIIEMRNVTLYMKIRKALEVET